MKYKVIVYYDNTPDSEHIFNSKNDAINELHRLRGVKYRNSRMYTVELEDAGFGWVFDCEGIEVDEVE